MLTKLLEIDTNVFHTLLEFIPTRIVFKLRRGSKALRKFVDEDWRPRHLTLVELKAFNSSWTRRPPDNKSSPYLNSLRRLTSRRNGLAGLISLSCPRVDAEMPSLRLLKEPKTLPMSCQISIDPPILRSESSPRLFVDIAKVIISSAGSLQDIYVEFPGVARQSACVCRFLATECDEGECCSDPVSCWAQLLEEVSEGLFRDALTMTGSISEWRAMGNLWSSKVPHCKLTLPHLQSLRLRGSCTFPLLFLFRLLGLDSYPSLCSLDLVLAEVGPADVFQMHGGLPPLLSTLFKDSPHLHTLKLHRGTWSLNGAVEYETQFILPSLCQFANVRRLVLEDDTMTESRLLIEGAVSRMFFPHLKEIYLYSVDRTYLLLRNELMGAKITIENVVLRSGLRGLLRYQPGGPEDPETVARMLALHNTQAVNEGELSLIKRLSVELSNSARISEDVYVPGVQDLFVWEDYVKSVPDAQPVLPWLHLPSEVGGEGTTSLRSITFMSLPFVTMEDLDELTHWANQQRVKIAAHPDFALVWKTTRNVFIAPQRGFPTCGVWDLCRKTLGDELTPKQAEPFPWLNPAWSFEGEFGLYGHSRKQWHLGVQSLYPLQRHSAW